MHWSYAYEEYEEPPPVVGRIAAAVAVTVTRRATGSSINIHIVAISPARAIDPFTAVQAVVTRRASIVPVTEVAVVAAVVHVAVVMRVARARTVGAAGTVGPPVVESIAAVAEQPSLLPSCTTAYTKAVPVVIHRLGSVRARPAVILTRAVAGGAALVAVVAVRVRVRTIVVVITTVFVIQFKRVYIRSAIEIFVNIVFRRVVITIVLIGESGKIPGRFRNAIEIRVYIYNSRVRGIAVICATREGRIVERITLATARVSTGHTVIKS